MNSSIPSSYTAIRITAPGGPEVMHPVQLSTPQCGHSEILIRVAAAGVNRHDVNQRRRGPDAVHSDVPGLEVAGTIVAVGDGVTGWNEGDAVCALVDGGGYAQYALAQAAESFPVPSGLSLTEAAALPEAMFTVWYNFFHIARLAVRERVLVHGGTSGVGTIAIQLLGALGHDVYATCSTEEKCELARTLGARDAFNYRTTPFADEVLARTGSAGVDVILDMAGGAHTEENVRALAKRGRIVHLSPGNSAEPSFPLRQLMQKEAVITGSLLRPLPAATKANIAKELSQRIWPLIGEQIWPQVTRTFPLIDAQEAHRLLEGGEQIGKIVLVA